MAQEQTDTGFGPLHTKLAGLIDRGMSVGAQALGWCGKNGKKGGPSVIFADLFWVSCNCCLFYRGVFVGITGLAFLQLLMYVISVAVVSAFALGIVAALAAGKAVEIMRTPKDTDFQTTTVLQSEF